MDEDQPSKWPLTHAQKRIWYLEQMHSGTPLFSIGGTIRVRGAVDFNLLEAAIHRFISMNDGIRLRITVHSTEPAQYISDAPATLLDRMDFSSEEHPEYAFRRWVEAEARKPFQLTGEPLFYFALFSLGDQDCGYFVKLHHIIADGWSTHIMTEQITDSYEQMLKGTVEREKGSKAPSYLEYIASEERYLVSARAEKNKRFWMEKFRELPEYCLKAGSNQFEGRRLSFLLDKELSGEIKAFVQACNCSINTFFVTVFLLWLKRSEHMVDLVLGTPTYNRSSREQRQTFGMFTSPMVLRICIDEEDNTAGLLQRVDRELQACYYNQRYPYNLLAQELELRKKGYADLFNICVNYYNTRLPSRLNGAAVENTEFYNGYQAYTLQLVIKEWTEEQRIGLDFDYRIADYSEEQVQRMYRQLTGLIRQAVRSPQSRLAGLKMLSEAEYHHKIIEFNNTRMSYPADRTIIELFREQAKRTPEQPALLHGQNTMTYRELDRRSNHLAMRLSNHGLGVRKLAAIIAEPSPESVIALLGVLKAGATYLPIDPDYPAERISYLLHDAEPDLLIVNTVIDPEIMWQGPVVSQQQEEPGLHSLYVPAPSPEPNDLAYIIYTSGTTGTPKGTMITHKGLVNYCCWARSIYTQGETETFALYSSLAFDLTVTSIFVPLISGGQIVIYPKNPNRSVLHDIVNDNLTTVLKLTPAHLALLQDGEYRNSSIKRMIVGGEELKGALASRIVAAFGGDIEIYNEYGPTETVVGCMFYRYNPARDTAKTVPIGEPIANTSIYILDELMRPVPVGATGELYIGGDGVGRGYHRRGQLTAERFPLNPFTEGERLYRTGDKARFITDSCIEYIGRTDRQINLKGYRIELNEIEQVLADHPAVKMAAVTVYEDSFSVKHLCAYLVMNQRGSLGEVRSYLASRLPHYMVPPIYEMLDHLPLTINGKIDTAALPAPAAEEGGVTEWQLHDTMLGTVHEIISQVLGLKAEELRPEHNFFFMGGDSIKAILISSKLHDCGLELQVMDILKYPVLGEMYTRITRTQIRGVSRPVPAEGSLSLTPVMRKLLSGRYEQSNYYNQSILLDINEELPVSRIVAGLEGLVRHHDSLRLNYDDVADMLFYNPEHLMADIKVETYDLRSLPVDEQGRQRNLLAQRLKSGFDIGSDLLLSACIFELGGRGRQLLITAHHLVVDGVSWHLLLDDLRLLLNFQRANNTQNLPGTTASFKEWTEFMHDEAVRLKAQKEAVYWNKILEPDYAWPLKQRGEEQTAAVCMETIEAALSEEETCLLMTRANEAYRTETQELVLTSFLKGLCESSGQEHLLVELESHGREGGAEAPNVSRTVGWFTCHYPARFMLDRNAAIEETVISVKEQFRTIPRGGIGYGLCCGQSDSIVPQKRLIRFNYMGGFDMAPNPWFTLSADTAGEESDEELALQGCLWDANIWVAGGRLRIRVSYNELEVEGSTLSAFMQSFVASLTGIIRHCAEQKAAKFSPADFDTISLSADELNSLFI
ncbi:amino acid adenylation domain-containing protein [Paenibacillus sp. FSL H7-0756]|uniref:amino acid adenylation domain-containing protein n=1 Tax=Paenibacillus sp. FSL H7-0756 TaxID=2954738 RepID=UPI0030FA3388